ncbi:hypothetical protein ACTFIT_006193 [Dictyostelium discoideum]
MKDKKETFHIVEKLVDSLKKSGIIIDDLSLGPFKYMGICKLPSNIKLDNIDCKKEKNDHYSDNDDDEKEEEGNDNDDDDDDDCSTKKINSNNEEDATSDGEEFEDDSDATEPEDESKRLPPKKILKKKTLKLEKENIKKPKTTTKTTTSSKNSENNNNNNNNNKTINNNNNNFNTHIARRIDFKLIPIESYYFGLLHNTGSDEFNRQMRAIALSKGYTLSEYSINKFSKESGKDDQIIPVNSEEEIFKIIGMKYYPPQERKL